MCKTFGDARNIGRDSRAVLCYWGLPKKKGALAQQMRSANNILADVDKLMPDSDPGCNPSAINASA